MKKLITKTLTATIAILFLANLSVYSQTTSSFTGKINNSKDLTFLNWSISSDMKVNYFLLQRSTDGINFDNQAMVFANDVNNISNGSFSYDDDLSNMSSDIIYYRLQVIDTKGQSKYSDVIEMKIERDMQQAKMLMYPSASTDDINIAIPEKWQGKKASYSVYNLNGEVVKAFTNANAPQTESFDIAGTPAGIYTVKINSGVNSSVIQFIKTR